MQRLFSILLLTFAEVLVLSLWFSVTAVSPQIAADFALSPVEQGLLTSAVIAGFIVGCLVSAAFNLADSLEPRLFFSGCALLGALANYLFLFVDAGSVLAILLRFSTGAVMAGIYPVGMKIAVSWARNDAGLLVGFLVAGLTVGSATPYLFAWSGGADWRSVLVAGSFAACVGGIAILFIKVGPAWRNSGKLDMRLALDTWRKPGLRLANFGYYGHMWELYAVWAGIAFYLTASFQASGLENAVALGRLAGFSAIAIGFVGAFFGGYLADRIGRTALTMASLLVSGICCLLAGPLFGTAPMLVFAFALVWGIAVIADSAQFSASIAELAEPGTQGTMLTTQNATGFAIALVSVQLLPGWVDSVGWDWAFVPLAIGPAFGFWAMWRLRGLPEAEKLAGGRR